MSISSCHFRQKKHPQPSASGRLMHSENDIGVKKPQTNHLTSLATHGIICYDLSMHTQGGGQVCELR